MSKLAILDVPKGKLNPATWLGQIKPCLSLVIYLTLQLKVADSQERAAERKTWLCPRCLRAGPAEHHNKELDFRLQHLPYPEDQCHNMK